LKVATTALQWSPAEFWASTTDELMIALAGWKQANGIDQGPKPLTRDELDDLMERFPDG